LNDFNEVEGAVAVASAAAVLTRRVVEMRM
jgi:hypothetical protein